MSQEPTLFNCSIAENISYGLKENVTPEDIERVSVSHTTLNYLLSIVYSLGAGLIVTLKIGYYVSRANELL